MSLNNNFNPYARKYRSVNCAYKINRYCGLKENKGSCDQKYVTECPVYLRLDEELKRKVDNKNLAEMISRVKKNLNNK